MTSVADAVRKPDRFFSRRLAYVDAIVPLALAIGVGVALAYAYRPFFVQAVLGSLPANVAPGVADALAARAFRFSGIGAAIVPLVQIGAAATLMFMILAVLSDTPPRFESLFVCVAWAALLLVGKDLARYGMLLAGGLESVRQITDLQPGVGLGFLVAEPRSLAHDSLEVINGFDLSYLVVVAGAASRSEGVRFRRALTAAALSWLLLHAVRIGFGALFYP